MDVVTDMMSKFNQIQLLCFWISYNTKFKIINNFNGKDGHIIIKIYDNDKSIKSSSIHKIENLWLKKESIVLKEMDIIIQYLLVIKTEHE